MTTVEQIRNGLIEKILSIDDEKVLKALDQLVSSTSSELEIIELTDAQKRMLEMSEEDIQHGRLISQEAMNERNVEWLNRM